MDLIYMFILIAAISIEISTRCNTRNIVKKLSLFAIMIGAVVAMATNYDYAIEVAFALYFASELYCAYSRKKNRRLYDRVAQ